MPYEEHDIPVVNAGHEISVVTTDIAVTPCPAYTNTTFTETEVIPVVTVTTDCGYEDVDTSPETIVVTTPTKVLVNSKQYNIVSYLILIGVL